MADHIILADQEDVLEVINQLTNGHDADAAIEAAILSQHSYYTSY